MKKTKWKREWKRQIRKDRIKSRIKEILPHRIFILLKRVRRAVFHTGLPLDKSGNPVMDLVNVRSSLKRISPRTLLTKDRLDFSVRYLLFRDIAYGIENKQHLSLYARMMLSINGGNEPEDNVFNQSGRKDGIDEFVLQAKSLFNSIKINGFDDDKFVALNAHSMPITGSHRIVASLLLGQDITVGEFPTEGFERFSYQWFVDNGFDIDDLLMILRGYADMYEDCGMFVLYAPVQKKWNYMESVIRKSAAVVGSVDLDFEGDYIAFENLIRDIYLTYSLESFEHISLKVSNLKLSPLIVRVILVSNEGFENDNLLQRCRALKDALRKTLTHDIDENVMLTMHSSDTHEEFQLMKRILLSPNNQYVLRRRFSQTFRDDFLLRINELIECLKKHDIDTDEFCIFGSSVLEVFGIRKSNDIDIIASSKVRDRLDDSNISLPENCEVLSNCIYNENGDILNDDIIINNYNYHFIFSGCKFANIELVEYNKKAMCRDKDIKDIRLIELYKDYVRFFDNKEILQRQIEKELERQKY